MPSNLNPLEPSRFADQQTHVPEVVTPRRAPPWMPSLARPKRELPLLRMDQVFLWILLLNLVALGAIAIKNLGLTQTPQIVVMVLAVGLGLFLGITRARLRRGFVRATWVAIGVALAVAAWWFVPTIGGMNRWTAEHEAKRLLAELENMPIGDGQAYRAHAGARAALVAEFPELEARFDEPTKAWTYASIEEWKKKLAELAPGDCQGLVRLRADYTTVPNPDLEQAEINWFRRTYEEMEAGDIVSARAVQSILPTEVRWQKLIQPSAEAWASRTVTQAITRADEHSRTDPIRSSSDLHTLGRGLADLGVASKILAKLRIARHHALQASMTATQREAIALLRKERYQAAAAVCDRLKSELALEAKELGLEAELAQIVDSYGFLADLARQAGKTD